MTPSCQVDIAAVQCIIRSLVARAFARCLSLALIVDRPDELWVYMLCKCSGGNDVESPFSIHFSIALRVDAGLYDIML